MSSKKELRVTVEKLISPKPALPGRVRTMKSHCGKKGCKCMDPVNPQKHSYNQLSCSRNGKTKTMYVKDCDFRNVEKMCENYAELRQASLDLGYIMLALCKEYDIETASTMMLDEFDNAKRKSIGLKPEAQKFREMRTSRDKWKTKKSLGTG